MRISYVYALAASCAAAASVAAQADLVPPGDDRFSVQSMIYSSPVQEVGNYAATLGSITAELDTATYGLSSTTLDGQADHLSIRSSMAIRDSMYMGESTGAAYYHVDGTSPVTVDWNWLNLTSTGGWRVWTQDSAGDYTVLVAALEFNATVFSERGGSFSHTGAGSTTLDLGAGDYRFEAYYSATTMPSTSQVDFYFVPVPAPGAMALLGVAGAIAGARRRA